MRQKSFAIFVVGSTLLLAIHCDSSPDDGTTDSGTATESTDTGTGTASTDSATATEITLTCEDIEPCVSDTDGIFSCPDEFAGFYSCKRMPVCGDYDTVMCVTDEEACLVACGKADCVILDSDPQLIDCSTF